MASHEVTDGSAWHHQQMVGRRATVRVLVVDDHADFRAAITALLQAEGFEVVGHAGDAGEALTAIGRLTPDVVLLDVRLPDVDGLTLSHDIANLPHPPEVVLVSSRDATAYGTRLTGAPVRGFLSKSELSGLSLRAVLD